MNAHGGHTLHIKNLQMMITFIGVLHCGSRRTLPNPLWEGMKPAKQKKSEEKQTRRFQLQKFVGDGQWGSARPASQIMRDWESGESFNVKLRFFFLSQNAYHIRANEEYSRRIKSNTSPDHLRSNTDNLPGLAFGGHGSQPSAICSCPNLAKGALGPRAKHLHIGCIARHYPRLDIE